MEFVHRSYDPHLTIAALATPPGEGGVAIVRISGKEAISIAAKLFSGPVQEFISHTAHYGKFSSLAGQKIDDVLLLVMKGRRSFTGEDTVEIHCHGGRLISQRVLEAIFEAGARPAAPGEFSQRAFLNGKIDLAQAEAIQALIHAKNERAMQFATEQLEGALSNKIKYFQKELTSIAAILEAWVDFPEEDLEFASFEEIIQRLETHKRSIENLIATFHHGKVVHDGITVSLVGSPNVGKSSLLNVLLGKERAIVSPIAGTTRDVIEADMRLEGLHVRLLDTAGIRETIETIENEGIMRSKKALQASDLILFVCDVTAPHIDTMLLELIPHEKTIVVWNKIDLPHKKPLPKVSSCTSVEVSVLNNVGLDELKTAISTIIYKQGNLSSKDEVVISQLRHKESLCQAVACIEKVITGLQTKASPEFVSYDLYLALKELGTVIGTNVTEDVLTAIFSQFCIGK